MLFNDEHLAPPEKKSSLEFHPFSRLPHETRLCIWSLSLFKQRRFIPICAKNVKDDTNTSQDDQVQPYSTQNELGNIVSGSHYELSINAPESFIASPLFSTTRESRFVALEFYRLRMPLVRGQIRISPEYDVVFLHDANRVNNCFAHIFVDVLHDMKAYDPKDEGVKHLAIRGCCITDHTSSNQGHLAYSLDQRFRTVFHPIAAASIFDILSTKLRSLWCIEKLLYRSRVYGPIPADWHFGGKMPHILETCPLVPPMSKIGRSCIGFDYIENDPRPVQEDLKFLAFMHDPRRFYRRWSAIEESLGVRRTDDFSFNVCITSEMEPLDDDLEAHVLTKLGIQQMVDRNHQVELDLWQHTLQFWGSLFSPKTERHMQSRENGTTAIGMWVFPGDAFEKENSHIEYEKPKQVFRVSEPPALVVFDI